MPESSTFNALAARIGSNPHGGLSMNQDIEQLHKLAPANYKPDEKVKAALINYSGRGQVYDGSRDPSKTGAAELYEFYTPYYICEKIWQLVEAHGGNLNGKILEPAAGTGRFFQYLQQQNISLKNAEAFELNPVTAWITEKLYPEATVYQDYFETAFLKPPRFRFKEKKPWLKGYPFDVIVGNPPYGSFAGKHKWAFEKERSYHQVEIFFLYKALELLKPGGIVAYLTASSYLRNYDHYEKVKADIAKIGELVDAYRLPQMFERTAVPTDILIFRKK